MKKKYVCTLDGCDVRSFDNEQEAIVWCLLYDGERNPEYHEDIE